MHRLEIRHRTGLIETRELSRKAPLLVGSHETSDICVDAAGVAPIHCRISWKKPNYEVTAVVPSGVQWNGSVVQHAVLSPGDVVRVGDIDIVLQAERTAVNRPAPPEHTTDPRREPDVPKDQSNPLLLKALSDDGLPASEFGYAPSREHRRRTELSKAAEKSAAAEKEAHKTAEARRGPTLAERLDLLETTAGDPREKLANFENESRTAPPETLAGRLSMRPVRPGEQDPLRSPLVLGMGAAALILMLGAGSIWFLLQRESAQRQFDSAQEHLQKGSYAQAIEQFEAFVKGRPRHALAPRARVALATARVDKEIAGSAPAWDLGLAALNRFIEENRDSAEFQDPGSESRRFVIRSADRIAFGAAESARDSLQRDPLTTSSEAARLLELHTPAETPPTERLQELAKAVRSAEAALLRQEVLDKTLAEIDVALGQSASLKVLELERRLLTRYSELASNKTLRERVKKALEIDQRLVRRDESDREALPADVAALPIQPLSLTRRTRTRSDIGNSGVVVLTVAEDCCYGVDAASGQPIWRRPIGAETPFVPFAVSATVPSLLLFDGRRNELQLCDLQTGQTIWRQPVDGHAAGAPLVFEGQVFLSLRSGQVLQIDLNTGRRSTQLTFPQGLSGPAVASHSGEHLYVPGNQELIYKLQRRPLGCTGVVRLRHAPGAIEAPLLTMRSYLLVAENNRLESAQLRLFDLKDESGDPVEIASHRVDGQIRQPLVIRGKQLFVPSVPERITAFTLSETGDRRSLAFAATYVVAGSQGGPVFLVAGTDDQVWMTGTSLRRLELKKDSLLPDKQQIAAGISSQPLQAAADALFLGRRQPAGRAVFFARADRQRMALEWQVVLGAAIVGGTSPDPKDGTVVVVTSAGDLFRVSGESVARGGYELQPLFSLALPEGQSEALQAAPLDDGRIAVFCRGAEPRLWIVSGDGSAPQEIPAGDALQVGPVALAEGLLLPLSGRLRLAAKSGAAETVEDYLLPLQRAEPAAWRGVARIGDQQAATVNETGRVSRLELRSAPVRHLAEISHWEAGAAVDAPLAADERSIVIADSSPRVVMLDSSSLEPLAEQTLELPVHGGPWRMDGLVFLQLGRDRLACFDAGEKLKPKWSIPLDGNSLAGAPVIWKEKLVLARQDGEIILADRADGRVLQRLPLLQDLSLGPFVWKDALVVAARDGSLIALHRLLTEGP